MGAWPELVETRKTQTKLPLLHRAANSGRGLHRQHRVARGRPIRAFEAIISETWQAPLCRPNPRAKLPPRCVTELGGGALKKHERKSSRKSSTIDLTRESAPWCPTPVGAAPSINAGYGSLPVIHRRNKMKQLKQAVWQPKRQRAKKAKAINRWRAECNLPLLQKAIRQLKLGFCETMCSGSTSVPSERWASAAKNQRLVKWIRRAHQLEIAARLFEIDALEMSALRRQYKGWTQPEFRFCADSEYLSPSLSLALTNLLYKFQSKKPASSTTEIRHLKGQASAYIELVAHATGMWPCVLSVWIQDKSYIIAE